MDIIKKIITTLMLISIAFVANANANANANKEDLISMIPTELIGELKYATHKYWVTKNDGSSIELMVGDDVVDALDFKNKTHVNLNGAVLTYSDGSVYFKPSLSESKIKPKLQFNISVEDYQLDLRLDGSKIFESQVYRSAEIHKEFTFKNGKIIFVQLFTGGTSCPAESMLVIARYDSDPLMTSSFGTCSDIPLINIRKNQILMSFPGNPPENWIFNLDDYRLYKQ